MLAPLLAAVGDSLTRTGDAVEPDNRRGILAVLSVGLVNTIITATLDNPVAHLAIAVTLVAVAILYMTVFGWGAEWVAYAARSAQERHVLHQAIEASHARERTVADSYWQACLRLVQSEELIETMQAELTQVPQMRKELV
eukprot:jgi/Chrpa1/16027/Chrysochromulina_OHIO_Genome00021649-RA